MNPNDPVDPIEDGLFILRQELAGSNWHKVKRPGEAPSGPTPGESIDAELRRLRLSPGYFNRDHPKHKSLVARVQALTQQQLGN